VLLFLIHSRVTTGAWFTASGFYVPDERLLHDPLAVLAVIVVSTVRLGGDVLILPALAGAALCVTGGWRRAEALLPLSLATAAALPVAAFFQGHPLRVRYMVPLIVAGAVLAAIALARLPRRLQPWGAAGLCALSLAVRSPLDDRAPMITEAQWEAPYRQGREAITRYLVATHDGTPILASMGSLAHYMQDASASGFELSDFIHEGNGDLWKSAFAHPDRHVTWVLAEEQAEGGDLIARRTREPRNFVRVNSARPNKCARLLMF
jgi:hypothetical protein